MGNDITYGYKASGHGKFAVLCEDCHDLTALHTDADARTYSASSNNYRDGYRLNEDMAVPRNGESHPAAFRLCTNCHVYTQITGPISNFRDDNTGFQFHMFHLDYFPTFLISDSDFDGAECSEGTCVDSAMTCINCHNVHGSPTGPMIRHGELISTPGTDDKVPSLDFRWYEADGSTVTTVREESFYGALVCGLVMDVTVNHVCAGCHVTGELSWYRTPGNPPELTVEAVWTSDLSNVTKTEFMPNEDIRYHARFTLVGSISYFAKVGNSGAGNTASMPGTDWITGLSKQGTIAPDTYEVTWDETIPPDATPGSPAKLLIRIGIFDAPGGTLLESDEAQFDFEITDGP
jgi:hypothetical protein